VRGIVWLIFLFGAAVLAAALLGPNDALVAIHWRGWRADLSMNLFLLLVLLACFVIMATVRGLEAMLSLPQRAREWRALQRERGAQRALREALAEYFGARYGRAQKSAEHAVTIADETPEMPDAPSTRALARLVAAGSAHRLQDRTRRDELLRRIDTDAADAPTRAVAEGARLLAAEWALDDRDAPRALDLLAALPPGVGRRTQALRLKLHAQRLARQPIEALQTARLLAKHQAFSPVAAQGLVRSLAIEVLDGAHDADQLRRQWLALDAADRADAPVAARAAQRASAFGDGESARAWLAPLWERIAALASDERALLAAALMESTSGVGTDWLARAETALHDSPADAAIAGAAGAVFAERGLWGKARRPLEQAATSTLLAAKMRRRAWRWLAALAREQGDEARAAACDRAAAGV
jgi:HemY protein